MATGYKALKKFIHDTIIAEELELNPLSTTSSIVKSLVEQFRQLGWTVTEKPNPHDKVALHSLISPDQKLKLSMRGGKVYRHASSTESICRHKNLTKIMLELDNVQVPKGADFSINQRGVALEYFKKLPKPVVVKPTDAAGSRGVTVGITDPKTFTVAWQKAVEQARENSKILVEQFIPGLELRAYVVGDAAISVVARIQPYVVGDGSSTLSSLIEQLNHTRSVNIRTQRYGIATDWSFINSQGFEAISTPAKAEIVFLNPFTTGAVGGLAVEVSDLVSNDIKEMAVRATQAVPGLEVAGVDILTEDIFKAQASFVLEVNTAASPDLHRYATHGTPHDVSRDVVNYFDGQAKVSN